MRRTGTLLLGATVALLGLVLIAVGGRAGHDAAVEAGPTAVATITDLRLGTDRTAGTGEDRHEVRYLFGVNGTTYSSGDGPGRTDLFLPVGAAQWAELTVGGPIQVAYDPAEPARNRPRSGVGSGSPMAVALGLLLSALGVSLVLAARRRGDAEAPVPASGAVGDPPRATA